MSSMNSICFVILLDGKASSSLSKRRSGEDPAVRTTSIVPAAPAAPASYENRFKRGWATRDDSSALKPIYVNLFVVV